MDRAEQAREGVARAPVEEEPLVDMALSVASPLRRFTLTSERAILGFASVAVVLLAWDGWRRGGWSRWSSSPPPPGSRRRRSTWPNRVGSGTTCG